jgi:hypothetical protein
MQANIKSWTSGPEQWSQYWVNINVGSSPLYAPVIQAVTTATKFNAWNVNKVTFPPYF